MSYQRKVIYLSLGTLLGVTLLAFFGELLGGGRVDAMSLGLVALSFSLLEAFGLLVAAVAIALFGSSDKMHTDKRIPPEDLLDYMDKQPRRLTKSQRARAFCAAAGLVLLLGGSLCFGSLSFGGGLDVR